MRLKFFGMKEIILIKVGYERSAGLHDASLTSVCHATILLMFDVTQTRIIKLPYNLIGGIRRRIVNHDNFEILVCLPYNTLYSFA
jgi:hypothetical protein